MKRSWFQIHLSTAILMMLMSGLVVGLSVHPRITYGGTSRSYGFIEYGWPFPALAQEIWFVHDGRELSPDERPILEHNGWKVASSGLMADFVFCVVLTLMCRASFY